MLTKRACSAKYVLAAAVMLVLSVTACQEPDTGPTTEEFADARAEQEKRLAAKKTSGGGEKPTRKAPQPKAAGNASAAAFNSVDAAFVYDGTGKRDPFRDFKWLRPDRKLDLATAGPLEQYDLSQLSLVAVVWKTGNARALIQDPQGGSYIIAKGARVGKNSGRVLAIDDNSVRVKETYVDFLGRETTKDIELRMRGNEGG